MKKPCQDCPFKKDTLRGWLDKKRMEEITAQGSFVCHKNTDLQCAGHMLLLGQGNTFVRLATQMGIELELSGRELVFDTVNDCIKNHKNNHRGDK